MADEDDARAAKRRKLDDERITTGTSSAPQTGMASRPYAAPPLLAPKPPAPVAPAQAPGPAQPAAAAATTSASASQLWRQAKVHSKVYQRRINAQERASDPASSPGTGRKTLDPLRNQRAQAASIGSSPRREGGEVKGFFKRFHAPPEEPRDEATDRKEETKVNGSAASSYAAMVAAVASGAARKMKAARPAQTAAQKEAKMQLDRRKARELAMREADGGSIQVVPQAAPPPRVWRNATFAPPHLACIRQVVLEKTTRRRPTALAGLDDEYAKVAALVRQTVTAGESNSMLVIGARGSGKTALVDRALREQTATHADDFHVVRLSGFLHTDDKIALREIWRQLGREMAVAEDEGTAKNYADTLTTLLALLSHSDGSDGRVTKSVIFVMDEFDLFAGHPRQTLLYNLFDIAQSRKAPIAILGLTTRIDVAESLEKRVKSRFSHRYVYVGLARSLPAFERACAAALTLSASDLTAEERNTLGVASELTSKLLDAWSQPHTASALADWNDAVDHLLSSPAVSAYTTRLYHQTKAVPSFLALATLAFSTLPVTAPLSAAAIITHFASTLATTTLQPPDSKLALLASLSTLQLALLICAARLTAIYNTDCVSFVLAYEEYRTLAAKAKLQASAAGALGASAGVRIWGKDVARGAWETLMERGLVLEDHGGRHAATVGGAGRVDVGLEEIGACAVEKGMWGRWCREI